MTLVANVTKLLSKEKNALTIKLPILIAKNGKILAYQSKTVWYRAFQRFGQATLLDGGSVFGSSQFLILPQLPLKLLFDSKVVKIDPKLIISLR